ncbi:hypothetical protein EYB53_002055 [Candidatus Chloroploca sp. M-50]|uniref:ABC transporter permease n=1 Tax=Candidatus Chloroploca mongolica TaxID=2528176 RepID=A0ABS4D4X6_9CHLR|nr:hypothetical protein [Candidatus Chloroploca mongolica]
MLVALPRARTYHLHNDMLYAIGVLVRARLQITRNNLIRSSLGNKIGLAFLLGLGSLAMLGLYSFTRFTVSLLRDPEFEALLREAAQTTPGLPTAIAPLLAAVPSMIMLLALTLLIFSSFTSLLNSLYLAGDLDMLLVAPVPMRAVFVVKFFGGLLTQYLILFVMLAPVLVGYGHGMAYGFFYLVSVLVALLVVPFLPAGLGALLVMAVVRIIPARRARELVSILGGLIGVTFFLLSQFSRQFIASVAGPDTLALLLLLDMPLLPSTWAGRALVASGEGQWLALLGYGSLFLGMSLAIFAACLVLAERLYYDGWSNLANQGGKVRVRKANERNAWLPGSTLVSRLLPLEARALLAKDLRLFFRDLRNLQALIFPLALAGIWTFQALTTPNTIESPAVAWALPFVQLLSAGIAFFICLSISSVLAGTGISREGKAFWLLKLAPISASRLLLGKMTLAFLPFPVIGTAFLLILALVGHQSPGIFVQQWALLMLVGLGCAAFGIGLGAAFPRLDWENPQQQATWQSGCLSTIFYPLYLGLMLLLVAGSGSLGVVLGGGVAGFGIQITGWSVAAIVTLGVIWSGMKIGVKGLERIEL